MGVNMPLYNSLGLAFLVPKTTLKRQLYQKFNFI